MNRRVDLFRTLPLLTSRRQSSPVYAVQNTWLLSKNALLAPSSESKSHKQDIFFYSINNLHYKQLLYDICFFLKTQFWALGYSFPLVFFLNQHNPDVISNQIRAKRKEEKKKNIKCFKLQKVNTLEVPTFPFLNTVGCVTDVFWPWKRLTLLRPSPLRWLRQDFLLRRSRFCKSPFFDKTEASHSYKMHKKPRQIQKHNRYCTNWNSTAHRTISR